MSSPDSDQELVCIFETEDMAHREIAREQQEDVIWERTKQLMIGVVRTIMMEFSADLETLAGMNRERCLSTDCGLKVNTGTFQDYLAVEHERSMRSVLGVRDEFRNVIHTELDEMVGANIHQVQRSVGQTGYSPPIILTR